MRIPRGRLRSGVAALLVVAAVVVPGYSPAGEGARPVTEPSVRAPARQTATSATPLTTAGPASSRSAIVQATPVANPAPPPTVPPAVANRRVTDPVIQAPEHLAYVWWEWDPSAKSGAATQTDSTRESGPTPSDIDFESTVKHDVEALDSGNEAPTGVRSDGTTLSVADNPDGAGDAIYAYDLASADAACCTRKPGTAAAPVATRVAGTSNSAVRGPGSESEPVPEQATPSLKGETTPSEQAILQLLQAVRAAIAEGTIYTWQDGEHTRRVRLVSGLVVQSSGENTEDDQVVAHSGARSIVLRQDRHTTQDSEPVFVSEVGGGFMTLPGGVLLALDPDWGETRSNRFFSANGVKLSRVSKHTFSQNGFFVETEPGMASLELANKLAARNGVLISSPNWGRQLELR